MAAERKSLTSAGSEKRMVGVGESAALGSSVARESLMGPAAGSSVRGSVVGMAAPAPAAAGSPPMMRGSMAAAGGTTSASSSSSSLLRESVVGLAAAAERSFAAAEAAEAAEMAAARAAQRAVEAYGEAAAAVGEAEFRKLLSIARSAKGMTDTVTRSAAESSKEYMRRKVKASADPHVALRATQSALYASHRSSATVATYIKRTSLAPSINDAL